MDTSKIKLPRSRTEVQAAATTRRVLERGARRVASEFTNPDDDWDPLWLLVAGELGLFMIPGNVEKYDMVEAVGAAARKLGAIAVGHVNSSWAIEYARLSKQRGEEIQRYMETHGGSTEGLPERIEVLLVAIHTASRSQVWTAHIERHETAPPTLAKLKPWPLGGDVTGAMVDPVRAGLVKLG